MRASRTARSPLTWLGALIVVYLGYPLAAFVWRLATSSQRGFQVPGLWPALWVSVAGATVALSLATALGLPLAYALARSRSRWAAVVGVVVQVPLALPPLMSGIILVYVVGPYTYLGRLFGQSLTDSFTGVVIAMTFVSSPFLIVAARAAFASIDEGQLDVAATLGHRFTSRFLRVALPGAGHGIRAGMLLTWLRAFGEYGAVVVLAFNPASLPIYTYNQFSGQGLATTVAPTALALAVAVVAVGVSHLRAPVRRAYVAPRQVAATPFTPRTVAAKPVGFDLDYRIGSFHLELAHPSGALHLGVLGKSGSGKSALLRCVAGLYGSAPGPVTYGDRVVSEVAVEHRRVGYVAQGFALYPHLTVWRHLRFAGASDELASYWLEQLGLEGLANRLPSALSGGQRQRVGLAQVLCRSPEVLLLDEPFSALDVPVRLELRRVLRRLQRETALASVIVTHDPTEAAYLADELIVIDEGRELQSGASRVIFARPNSPEVARLVGVENFHEATVAAPDSLSFEDGRIPIEATALAVGTRVLFSIRPERVRVRAPSGEFVNEEGALRGSVVDVADGGTRYDVLVRLDSGAEMLARVDDAPTTGESCYLELDGAAVSLWPRGSDTATRAPA